jgi:hypothetical protein
MQPLRFNPITQHYVIELTGGTGRVESRKWRLGLVFLLALSVFHLTSPIVALSQIIGGSGQAPMTVTGSTGAIDEEDLAEYEVRNQFATIKDSVAAAAVTYRYNLVPVDDFKDCEGCTYNIRIRYRDTGVNQNVEVRLRRANTNEDGVVNVYVFDSDAGDSTGIAPPNSASNQTVDRVVTIPSPDVTHGDHVYFLEVIVTKTANDGTPSPGFIAFVISSAGGVVNGGGA